MELASTDLMLKLVTAGHGVTVLPDWLMPEDVQGMPIQKLRIEHDGLRENINLGMRMKVSDIDNV